MYSIPQAAYGGRVMLPPIPFGSSGNDLPLTAFFATCRHSELHSFGQPGCRYAECTATPSSWVRRLNSRLRSSPPSRNRFRRVGVLSRRARSSTLRRARRPRPTGGRQQGRASRAAPNFVARDQTLLEELVWSVALIGGVVAYL